MAAKVIEKQFKNMQKNTSPFCSAGPVDDDFYHWEGFIMGPCNSPYGGGVFKIIIRFPPTYPLQPPKVLLKIREMLETPDVEDPLVMVIGDLYRKDKPKFEEIARLWTEMYAFPL